MTWASRTSSRPERFSSSARRGSSAASATASQLSAPARRGSATQALALVLRLLSREGLSRVQAAAQAGEEAAQAAQTRLRALGYQNGLISGK